jgi:predicted  nucleic acid-binding Zn-ribbon protein
VPSSPPPAKSVNASEPSSPLARRSELSEGSPPPVLTRLEDDSSDDVTIVPTGEDLEDKETVPVDRIDLELKTPASLPRALGIWGDMRYVFAVMFGLRRIKVELAETESEIEAEKRSRDKQLAELARLAIADESVTTPAVEEGREKLMELEGARSKKAGAAAAAEEAIGAIVRERDKVAAERTESVAGFEAEVAGLGAEIEPLEKKRADLHKSVREFKLKVDAFDKKIEVHEGKLDSDDPSEVVEAEAAIASLRAERETIAAEEPILATQLQEIEPKLRDLMARRGELSKKISRLKRAEDESVVRTEERVAAVRAHKLVVDRAAKDMSREQNELLTDLGQVLYDDPPPPVVRLALPLKERVVTLARLKDRAVALREERASIEALPLIRGAAIWVLILGAIGAGVFLALTV